MACCNNKQGCEKRKEALLDAAVITTAAEQGASIIGKLMEIVSAGGGLMYLFKDDPKLTELAAAINILAAENQYLKKRLGEETTPTVEADAVDLTFKFGPQNAYSLTVPAGDPTTRSQLAGQLVKAAADLMGPHNAQTVKSLPGQQMLPFAAK